MKNIQAIGAHIKVKNFKKSLAFYTTLGFKQTFRYGPKESVKEMYNGATFDIGNGKLEIADGHRAVKMATFSEHVNSSKISLMVNVKSLVPILEKCRKNGIRVSVEPRHYYWGTLELVVKDPDGVVLVFIAPYSADEASAIRADESWADPKNLNGR